MAWNRSETKPVIKPKAKASPYLKYGIGIVLAGGVLAGLVYLLLSGGDAAQDKASRRRGLINDVGTNIVKRVVTNEVVKPVDPLAGVDPLNQKFGRLPDGRWTVPGRKKIHNVITNTSNADAAVPYNNGPEQIMYSIFSRQLGDMPLPLPTMSPKDRAHLTEILLDKVPYAPDDTEDIKLGKDIIQQAKDELKKYIREGGDPDTFFEYYHNELSRSFEERKLAMKMVFDSARDEDPEISAEFCKKVNERLAEKGIKPIAYPRKLVELKKGQTK